MRINVIMPSYLGEYPNCASNRVEKFNRAIKFFFDQDYSDKKLIIVGDNCNDTAAIIKSIKMNSNMRMSSRISLLTFYNMPTKQNQFSGSLRTKGIEIAQMLSESANDITCYLDTDDVLQPFHLLSIAQAFTNHPDADWIYFNDNVATGVGQRVRERVNAIEFGRIGTSAIAHKTNLDIAWPDGYGHDWEFIKTLFGKYPNYKYGGRNGYVVMHIPGQIDF